MRPSLAEMLILTVLLGASISSFWFRFRKVVRTIRAAKPEKTWSLLQTQVALRLTYLFSVQVALPTLPNTCGPASGFAFLGALTGSPLELSIFQVTFPLANAESRALMGQVNWGRVIVGGLAAGVIINAFEYGGHRVLLDDAWTAAFRALGKTPTGWSIAATALGGKIASAIARQRRTDHSRNSAAWRSHPGTQLLTFETPRGRDPAVHCQV